MRREIFVLAAVLAVILTSIGTIFFYTVERKESTGRVNDITMTAYYWGFDQSRISVDEGDKVRLVINNVNNMMPMMSTMFPYHGIEIEGYDIDHVLPVGRTVTIEFVANKTGTFHFHCSVYCGMGHESMHGELTVNESDQGGDVR